MCRDYYLHRRNGIFYVEFIDKESGVKLPARSTGEKELLKAQLKAELWKVSGMPTGKSGKPRSMEIAVEIEGIIRAIRKADLNPDDAMRIVSVLKNMELIDIAAVRNTGRGSVPFIRFLETFWDYDKSEYIQDKLSHGYRFSRCHAYECLKRLKKDIKPFFGDKKLNCVTTEDLEKLTNLLAARGLATSTIHSALLICCTPLKWAFKKQIIPSNPAFGLTKFSITNKERGVLTKAEAAAVFAVKWKDKRAFVASLVAATTGARQGECLALRLSDIGEDTINIIHSYSPIDGLKCPKNGHKRVVPLLPEVKDALLDLLKDNPFNVDNPFIFYSTQQDKPTEPNIIREGLNEAMIKIKVDYKGRNITFHSWRHFFCSQITQQIEGEKVAKVSGHLSEEVFKRYAGHIEAKNIQEVGNAAAQVFENIVQFRKAG